MTGSLDTMTDSKQPGVIAWTDLTVPDADRIRDFYSAVVGWTPSPVDMGGYSDYCMNAADGNAVAGVCHARGSNADLPPVWLVYVRVADLEGSVTGVRELGGEVLVGPKDMGSQGRYAVIRDPAGAVCALYQETGK